MLYTHRVHRVLYPSGERALRDIFEKWHLLFSHYSYPADTTSIFYTIVVRHSKSRTEIVWKMS